MDKTKLHLKYLLILRINLLFRFSSNRLFFFFLLSLYHSIFICLSFSNRKCSLSHFFSLYLLFTFHQIIWSFEKCSFLYRSQLCVYATKSKFVSFSTFQFNSIQSLLLPDMTPAIFLQHNFIKFIQSDATNKSHHSNAFNDIIFST